LQATGFKMGIVLNSGLLPALVLILSGICFSACTRKTGEVVPITTTQGSQKLVLYQEKNQSGQYTGLKISYNSLGKPTRIALLSSTTGIPSETNYDDYFYNGANNLSQMDHYVNGVKVFTRFFDFSKGKCRQDVLYTNDTSFTAPVTTIYRYNADNTLNSVIRNSIDSTAYSDYASLRPGRIEHYTANQLTSVNKRYYDSYGNLLRDSAGIIDPRAGQVTRFYITGLYRYDISKPAINVPDVDFMLYPDDHDRGLLTFFNNFGYVIRSDNRKLVPISGSSYTFNKFQFNGSGYPVAYLATEILTAHQDSYLVTIQYQ
jgi:hypothetical protein